ncbi:MAG: PepSY domain-containing protein [Actinomycetota bacterium]|nr:PepSY domain-containing protein [Actinomycetota bacterium]
MQEHRRRACSPIAGLAALLAIVAGCGGDSSEDDSGSNAGASSGSAQPQQTTASSDATPAPDEVTEEEARQIALDAVGGGQVTEVEQDDEDGRAVWKIKITAPDGTEQKVTIDRASGEVVDIEVDTDD